MPARKDTHPNRPFAASERPSNAAARSNIGILLLGTLMISACAFRETADWTYVSNAWGGMLAGEAQVKERTVIIPLQLGIHPVTRPDSAICVNGTKAKLVERKVEVLFKKGLCGDWSQRGSHEVEIRRPPAGQYTIVYADKAAGYPPIGVLQVPEVARK